MKESKHVYVKLGKKKIGLPILTEPFFFEITVGSISPGAPRTEHRKTLNFKFKDNQLVRLRYDD